MNLHEMAAMAAKVYAESDKPRKSIILYVDDGPPPLPVFKEKTQMEIVLHPSARGTFKKNFVEPGRNAPCYCGSGRKYKNCCLDKNYAVVRDKCAAASKKNMGATLPPAAEAPRPPSGISRPAPPWARCPWSKEGLPSIERRKNRSGPAIRSGRRLRLRYAGAFLL